MAAQITIDTTHSLAAGVSIRATLERRLDAGSILVLFGPSGAGKTTILRALAGVDRPTAGTVVFDGETWVDVSGGRFVAPQARGIGYVTQEPALFPHLTARGNVEFGVAGLPPAARRQRGDDLMASLGIANLAARHARALSGGEAQRVALARALAPSPRLLLLDEPFGALDSSTRRTFRTDVRALVRASGASAILVTHDRLEAMTMGDDIAVMIGGRIRQVGRLVDVFRRPADQTVAQSLGIETVLPAIVEREDAGEPGPIAGETNVSLVQLRVGSATLLAVSAARPSRGDEVFACIRGEDVTIERRGPSSGSARNHLAGVVLSIEAEGPIDRVTIDCGFEIVALITRQSREDLSLAPGSPVAAVIKATAILVVPKA
jgi:molybdate transport system ATP-binding protein